MEDDTPQGGVFLGFQLVQRPSPVSVVPRLEQDPQEWVMVYGEPKPRRRRRVSPYLTTAQRRPLPPLKPTQTKRIIKARGYTGEVWISNAAGGAAPIIYDPVIGEVTDGTLATHVPITEISTFIIPRHRERQITNYALRRIEDHNASVGTMGDEHRTDRLHINALRLQINLPLL
ncbi:hypothetical protein EJ08DRAFT_655912 [Tothia fuscella]|uniref:Uncharacterized protein n=1 Tax=Tothia fuscella TaxID=1048955 RepID=A0A9P4P108_9PEZI|nr:hypothetical protein EJ08DRAFT_655912 [Tothia fuscella]